MSNAATRSGVSSRNSGTFGSESSFMGFFDPGWVIQFAEFRDGFLRKFQLGCKFFAAFVQTIQAKAVARFVVGKWKTALGAAGAHKSLHFPTVFKNASAR